MSQPSNESSHSPDDVTGSQVTREDMAGDDHLVDLQVEKIDRYLIKKVLGQGGFGVVFLAVDPRLEREVAIKIPRVDKPVDEFVWQQFIDEGRAVANLKHDAIIQVFDINRQANGIPYVVMEFVEGQTLKQLFKERKPSIDEIVKLIRQIAAGLLFAHKQHIVHRDLKPSNIIVDKNGQARIADFGLAIHDNTPIRKLPKNTAGTMPFMSPEQLRGENHRLDGRTDLWALGVTIYWMLTGSYPFVGENSAELIAEICSRDPKPVRQLNEDVPVELERICNRCLCRLMPERYQSAREVIDDIDYFLQKSSLQSLSGMGSGSSQGNGSPGSASANRIPDRGSDRPSVGSAAFASATADELSHSRVQVVPKGLRSFDAGDVEFFLNLLPGPTDRFGVPDSLRFWIQAYSKTESNLPIGLLYGPSGSGKTSFVRAGLMPRLPEEFLCVRIECTSDTTEKDIVRAIGQSIDESMRDTDIRDMLFEIRNGEWVGRGRRLLIVLDQFEQWLNANDVEPNTVLVEALRQCDGIRVQCLLLVRDDFWIPTHQFLKQLDVKIQEGKNSQALPLFDERHARKVLTGFGQAYGSLPSSSSKFTRKHREFVKQAVDSLSLGGKVICAHLSLFSEMMKGRDWTSGEFSKVGGWQGIGVRYLEEAFGQEVAPAHRQMQMPYAKEMLSQLVPETGVTIKTSSRTKSEMADSWSGNWNETAVAETLETLDSELRLVTRVVSDVGWTESSSSMDEPRYQLSHDVLVEPIRTWISQKQRETWRGRAEVRLDELASQWSRSKENRLLPSFPEFLTLSFGTRKSVRNEEQRSLMRVAGRRYGAAATGLLLTACLCGYLYSMARSNVTNNKVEAAVAAAVEASPDGFASQLEQLKDNASVANRAVSDLAATTESYRLALIQAHCDPEFAIDDLLAEVPNVRANECENFVDALRVYESRGEQVADKLAAHAKSSTALPDRFKYTTLAIYFSNLEPLGELFKNQVDPTGRTRYIAEFKNWHGNLAELVSEIEKGSDSRTKKYLCDMLAMHGGVNIGSAEMKVVSSWLIKQYQQSPNAGLHFSAKTALNRWGVETVDVKPSDAANWIDVETCDGNKIQFIEVQPGTAKFRAGLPEGSKSPDYKTDPVCKEPFWISSREVSADLFFEFVDDPKTSKKVKERLEESIHRQLRRRDIPIGEIKFSEAAQFCNWLSRKHGFAPSYEAKSTGAPVVMGESTVGVDEEWVPVNGGGFRLPTTAEWDIACRAGSETAFFFGDATSANLIDQFAWCSTSVFPWSEPRSVGPRAAKIPNEYGIYDMLGNVSEFSHDLPGRRPGALAEYIFQGSSTTSSVKRFYSAYQQSVSDRFLTSFNVGIRLVFSHSPDR